MAICYINGPVTYILYQHHYIILEYRGIFVKDPLGRLQGKGVPFIEDKLVSR